MNPIDLFLCIAFAVCVAFLLGLADWDGCLKDDLYATTFLLAAVIAIVALGRYLLP